MMLKTFNITLGVLVAFSVWCAAATFAIFVAVLAAILPLHVVVIGGLIVYYLMDHPYLTHR